MKVKLNYFSSSTILFILLGFGLNGNDKTEKSNYNISKETIKSFIRSYAIPFSTTIISYDSNGHKTLQVNYERGSLFSSSLSYKYNDFGDLIELHHMHPGHSEKLDTKTVYIYNKNRSIAREIEYLKNGGIKSEINYSYDDDGKLILQEYNNNEIKRIVFKYNNSGSNYAKTLYYTNGSIETENYDQKNRKLGNGKNGYIYDDLNNLIEEYHDKSDGFIKYTYKIKYNDYNDWIEKNIYITSNKLEMGRLIGTEIRELTYSLNNK